ncbi:hypothetical protein WJX73_000555 [Symbiochloris irregularis]|uniref:Uncharacterized protein n=1 Tax=Symbiochloris irregularis TaxID=706552 RepID=A0AAW1NT29_9CHLO
MPLTLKGRWLKALPFLDLPRYKAVKQDSAPAAATGASTLQMVAGLNAATGALLGVCVGDAAGAPLEFPRSACISDDKVDRAMNMQGGGFYQVVGPGQGTDDTEATLCLAHGLAKSRPPCLPLNRIAQGYTLWMASSGLDVGDTLRKAFTTGCTAERSAAEACMKAARRENESSQSNNCLNRVVPLAIWAWQKDPREIASFAHSEAALSHPNAVVQDCSAAYCIAIAQLIRSFSLAFCISLPGVGQVGFHLCLQASALVITL